MNQMGCCRKVVSHAKTRRRKEKALRRDQLRLIKGPGKLDFDQPAFAVATVTVSVIEHGAKDP